MAITTRARVALLLAVSALLIAGIAGGSQLAAGFREDGGGSEPGSGHGQVAGACVAPEPGVEVDCNDTIGAPVDPGECGVLVSGTGPDATVSSTRCHGDDDAIVPDPFDGAHLVEPTPGMSGVRARPFDKAVVGDGGSVVTVYFWSGVEPCYVLDHVEVDQGADAITITIFEGHDASAGDVACIDIALMKKVIVQLDAPVGDRRIVDGAA
jgi:hypothetical protein